VFNRARAFVKLKVEDSAKKDYIKSAGMERKMLFYYRFYCTLYLLIYLL